MKNASESAVISYFASGFKIFHMEYEREMQHLLNIHPCRPRKCSYRLNVRYANWADGFFRGEKLRRP